MYFIEILCISKIVPHTLITKSPSKWFSEVSLSVGGQNIFKTGEQIELKIFFLIGAQSLVNIVYLAQSKVTKKLHFSKIFGIFSQIILTIF